MAQQAAITPSLDPASLLSASLQSQRSIVQQSSVCWPWDVVPLPAPSVSSAPSSPATLRAPGGRSWLWAPPSESQLSAPPPGMPPTASTLHLGFRLLAPLETDLFRLLSPPCIEDPGRQGHATRSQVPSPQPRLARGGCTANSQARLCLALPCPCFRLPLSRGLPACLAS